MSRAHRRGPWVAEEDATLLSLVGSRGPNNWVQISQHMHFRSPKQCRERYHQNLKSSLNHEPISSEEGEAIEEMVGEMGKKWAEIARRLGNRSDNAVKNWWNGSQNRKKRSVPQHTPPSKMLAHRTQPVPAARHLGSSPPLGERRRSEERESPRHGGRRPWHDGGSGGALVHRSLRSDRGHASELTHIHVPSPRQPYDERRSPHLPYPRRDLPGRLSPSFQRPTGYSSHSGPRLPALGPIITDQAPRPLGPHALQPPLSAASMDAAPSLISDHNSTYSISPKTWPSPRSELPPIVVGCRPWHEGRDVHRRGSAPTISNQLALHPGGDEGSGAAITPSMSSDYKTMRPASLDYRPHTFGHRHSSSNPNSSHTPAVERGEASRQSTGCRDTRMNFSSLLN